MGMEMLLIILGTARSRIFLFKSREICPKIMKYHRTPVL
jgi:hypothetical protein